METVLRQERKRRGWSQQYVAAVVGVSRVAIQQLETGSTKPSYDVLVKLLDLFGYEDPRLLFGAETPEEHNACDENPHPKDTTCGGKQASKTVQANKAMHMQKEQKALEYRARS